MITITIQAANLVELQKQVETLSFQLGQHKIADVQIDENAVENSVTKVATRGRPAKKKTQKKKAVRKSKKSIETKTKDLTDNPNNLNSEGVQESVLPEGEAQTDTTISKETVKSALQRVNLKKGLPVARDLLDKFDAKKLSDLKEDDYLPFVQACEKLVGEYAQTH